MKNVQLIDSAINCTYDIFSIEDHQFELIFPDGNDVEFIEDVCDRLGEKEVNKFFTDLWSTRIDKKQVKGINGTLFFGLIDEKKHFYPTKKEDEIGKKGTGKKGTQLFNR